MFTATDLIWEQELDFMWTLQKEKNPSSSTWEESQLTVTGSGKHNNLIKPHDEFHINISLMGILHGSL